MTLDGFVGLLLPDLLSPVWAVALIVGSFFTSALTAAFGVGGGVAMLALMGLALPVSVLIPVHGAVQFGSNVGRAWHQREHISRRITKPFLIGSVIGALAGVYFVVSLPDAVMKTLLGFFVLVSIWAKIPAFDRLKSAGIAVGSAIIAFLSMLVGASGPMLSAFFSKLFPDDRKEMVATHAAGMSLHHGLKIAIFGLVGFAFWQWLPFLAAMIVSGYLGTVNGTRILHAMPEQTFRKGFKILLTVLALDLMRRGLMAF